MIVFSTVLLNPEKTFLLSSDNIVQVYDTFLGEDH